MRTTRGAAVAAVLALLAAACSLPSDDGQAPADPPPDVALDFSYQDIGGDGIIDQTLTITNGGDVAKAPMLAITPLGADGTEVADVTVQTAFGSDAGDVVVPALTEVIDILRFKGRAADEVVDVGVDVTDEGVLAEDVPPANDLQVQRFDGSGAETDGGSAASIAVANTYESPITVRVVGIEYQLAEEGQSQQFRRLTPLAGPVTIEAGATFDLDLPRPLRRRLVGDILAYLSR